MARLMDMAQQVVVVLALLVWAGISLLVLDEVEMAVLGLRHQFLEL